MTETRPIPDAAMRQLYDAGKDDRQIAAELGVSRTTVWTWRQQEKLQPQSTRRTYPPSPNKTRKKEKPPLDEAAAMDAWLSGKTDFDIARSIGSDLTAVAAWRKQVGLNANRAKPVAKGQTYDLPAAAVEAKARAEGLTYGQYQARRFAAGQINNVPDLGTGRR